LLKNEKKSDNLRGDFLTHTVVQVMKTFAFYLYFSYLSTAHLVVFCQLCQ